jgi:hypothetical protein
MWDGIALKEFKQGADGCLKKKNKKKVIGGGGVEVLLCCG